MKYIINTHSLHDKAWLFQYLLMMKRTSHNFDRYWECSPPDRCLYSRNQIRRWHWFLHDRNDNHFCRRSNLVSNDNVHSDIRCTSNSCILDVTHIRQKYLECAIIIIYWVWKFARWGTGLIRRILTSLFILVIFQVWWTGIHTVSILDCFGSMGCNF